jgi:DNA-binding CsgD family transcriptional regulator
VGGGSRQNLIGREQDIETLVSFLDSAARAGGAMLVSGEAGVGKTALLDGAALHAAQRGMRVLRSTGAEFEANVSFAGLNQLLHPLFDEIEHLRPTHADALSVSLGLRDGPRSDQLVASNAALDLVVRAGSDRPVLVLVDDLPWIDRASSAVLAFIARRTNGTRVAFLAALRTGDETFFERAGLLEHRLEPLDDAAAAALLRDRFPALTSRVRQRLLAEASGNPLALLELPASLVRSQSFASPPPAILPLSHRLQSVFASRVTTLEAPTRRLLLLAALDGTGDVALLARASSSAGPGLANLASAERAQLATLDRTARRLVFRHPLIRSAVVELATSEERQRAHEVLADCYIEEPARQAWHLAAAATGPDEAVASLLQSVAHGNLRRGDSVGAITELLRSADLSPMGSDRSERLAEAAYLGASVTGDLRSVRELLDAARRADPDGGGGLAGAVAGAYQLLNGHGDVDAAHSLLCGAVDALPDRAFDVHNQQLVEALYNLLLVCFFGGRPELWLPFHAALHRLQPRPPDLLATLAETLADPARTTSQALVRLDLAINHLPQETSPARIVRIGMAAAYLDRLPQCRGALWRAVEHGREGGAVTSAIESLFLLGNAALWSGEWGELAAVTEEGLSLCEAHGYRLLGWPGKFLRALTAAACGDYEVTTAVTDEMSGWAAPRGVRSMLVYCWHAQALAAHGRGDYEEAYRQSARISAPGSLTAHAPHALWVILDLVDAAVRTGRLDEAAAHVAALQEAKVDGLSSRLDLIVRGAAAMASTAADRAAALYDHALAAPGAERWPFDLARIQLAYGERLRRGKGTAAARIHLDAARVAFQRLGAEPWTQRAAAELRATGITIGRPDVFGPGALSPQQLEIARLAAAGMTNKEIGERLFLSPRTVGSHLYQIFPKLGITTRAALRDALDELPDQSHD